MTKEKMCVWNVLANLSATQTGPNTDTGKEKRKK